MNGSSAVTFADPSTRVRPFDSYDVLSQTCPVYHDPVTGNFVLTRFADIRKVAADWRRFSSNTGMTQTRRSSVAEEVDQKYRERGWLPIDTLITNDPPAHRRYRTLVDRVFTSGRVAAIEPRVEAIVARLIDRMVERDRGDFLDDFAVPLPMTVIAERLAGEPDRVGAFVEEVLRLHAPIQTLFRFATEEVAIGGTVIPAGSLVEVRWGAGNRDPERFGCPAAADLERANGSGHLAFGSGIHLCIGNQLARAELRLAFRALTGRFRDWAVDEDGVEMIDSFIAHGPRRLPIRWRLRCA